MDVAWQDDRDDRRDDGKEGKSPKDDEAKEGKRKRRGMWDVDASGNTVTPSADGAAAALAAVANPMAAMQQQAMMNALLQQQAAMTRRARRLHVGNLPPGLSGDALKELFNTTMQAAKLALDENPCVNDVHMSADNKFGFVEFRSGTETNSALALDGMQLLGKPLRVSRPNDYQEAPAQLMNVLIPSSVSSAVTSSAMPRGMDPARPNMPGGMVGGTMPGGMMMAPIPGMAPGANSQPLTNINPIQAALAAGTPVPAGQNLQTLSRRARRLHVGNLPLGVGLTAEMLKQFFNAALVSATLHDTSQEGDPVADAMLGTEGKFGFVEFRTIAETTSCIALNNIELGGKQLRIERPRDYAPMPESVLGELRAAKILGNTSVAPDGKDLLTAPAPPVATLNPAAALAAMPGGLPAMPAAAPAVDVSQATTVVLLANMVTPEEAANEQEMGEILEDTKTECEKHGKVTTIASAKPGAAGDPAAGLGADAIAQKVFVSFETTDAAIKCARDLHGKQFDGRQVAASFCAPEKFAALLLLPCHSC